MNKKLTIYTVFVLSSALLYWLIMLFIEWKLENEGLSDGTPDGLATGIGYIFMGLLIFLTAINAGALIGLLVAILKKDETAKAAFRMLFVLTMLASLVFIGVHFLA